MEEKLRFSLQNFFCGRGEGEQWTEILNTYLPNTCFVPGHTLGAEEKAVGKTDDSPCPPWGSQE